MKAVVCCVAIGGWYPRGAARLIETMGNQCGGITVQAHVNTLPFGAPWNVIENGYDYTGYCAKPFALADARINGADIAILVDAAFYAIRPIFPLIDYIAQNGYYLCRNGYRVGEWASDRSLERMNVCRDEVMQWEEASSYCVGLNFADGRCTELLYRWCGFASDRLTFPGPHTSEYWTGRNQGHVSDDRRVRGHRHDQTALSVIANQLGMTNMVDRPRFTAYKGSETAETVLVNEGMG